MAAATEKKIEGRGREVTGIALLAFGLFACLSLASMQVGGNRLMGPGGAATATGLYSLAGVAAYLVVLGLAVVAIRCFRHRPLIDGALEGLGAVGLLGATTILLHLPFAGSPARLRGPGGLLGQWLGEVTASFIGPVGAALAATTVLSISLLLVSEIRVREVAAVLGWAGRHVGRAALAGARAIGRVVVAIFPEKDDEAPRSAALAEGSREVATGIEAGAESTGDDARADLRVDFGDDDGPADGDLGGTPTIHPIEERSEAVRVGPATAPSVDLEEVDAERAALAEVVAEIAAVESYPRPLPPPGGPQPIGKLALDVAAGHVVPEDSARHGEATDTVLGDTEPTTTPPVMETPAPKPTLPIIVAPTQLAHRAAMAEAAELAAGGGDSQGYTIEAEAEDGAAASVGPGFIKLGDGAFQLPSTALLKSVPAQAQEIDESALLSMAERLTQAMSNYGIKGSVKEIHLGPVVTMYEFAPAPGTRTGKIASLEQDLAMALEAQAVRILAPIPGKSVVGVEVPNRTRQTVYLKEILEDSSFAGAGGKLQIALGKDIKGAAVSVNLAKMPHLLVAGTTGSGKSVAVNGMITSMLINASPEEVKFIMVDPKMLELSIYEGIPHLLLPVVTDPKKANNALKWAVDEMEKRYELLAKSGVRDIASYNARVEDQLRAANAPDDAMEETPSARERAKKLKVVIAGPDGTEQEIEVEADSEAPDGAVGDPMDAEEISAKAAAAQAAAIAKKAEPAPRKLPYIVIVIDEFADLMMVAPKDVEISVARIAQKARAAGLHLILATQRPSVDVITGLIKANFPSRVALQVASKIDSRTILDQPGAETLLGNGDMLFSDRGTKLRRVHGAFLSDEEVHHVVDFLKTQGKPVYDMEILKPREEDAEDGGEAPRNDVHDELYDKAVAIVCETRQASVSFIQRRLEIGYNRAARMVEQMERDGIVGPANGAKPREVVAPAGAYLEQGV